MGLQDLRRFTDKELSLVIFNTEHLYNYMIQGYDILSLVNEVFIYTDKQLEVLKQDILEYKV